MDYFDYSLDIKYLLTDDPAVMFSESYMDIDELLQEATIGTTIKNVGSKLWSTIVKGFSMLVRGIKNLINWIFKSGKRISATADQIASKIGLKKKPPVENNITRNDTSGEEHVTDKELKGISQIKDVVKKLEIQFRNDGSLAIDVTSIRHILDNMMNEPTKAVKKVHKEEEFWYGISIGVALSALVNPEKIDEVIRILNEISNSNSPESIQLPSVHSMLSNLYVSPIPNLSDDGKTIITASYEDLSEVLNRLDRLNDALSKAQSIDTNILYGLKSETVECLNFLASYVIRLQSGINTISAGMKQMYQVDAGYFNTISDPSLLANFANELMGSKIPPKYVAYNIVKVADKNIKGNNVDMSNLSMGHGRIVLFPKDKSVVYKVAYNFGGRRSNNNEWKIYKNSKGTTLERHLVTLYSIYNSSVLKGERVTTIDPMTVTNYTLDHIESNITKACAENNLPYTISDVHAWNIGKRSNGDYVLIDFGEITMTPR